MLVWLAVTLIAGPLALTLNSAMSGAGWEAQGSISQQVRDELRRDFPQAGAEAAIVTYSQQTSIVEDSSGLRALVAALQNAPGAAAVVDPLSLPAEAGMLSADGKVALIPVELVAKNDAQRPESAGELVTAVRAVSLPQEQPRM